MDKLKITGGKPLQGDIFVSGAKNAALPILMASILTSEPLNIFNVPILKDIDTTIYLLSFLGVNVHKSNDSIVLKADKISKT